MTKGIGEDLNIFGLLELRTVPGLLQDGPKRPKTAPRRPRMAPGRAQDGPERPKDCPGLPKDGPGHPKTAPRRRQDGPGGVLEPLGGCLGPSWADLLAAQAECKKDLLFVSAANDHSRVGSIGSLAGVGVWPSNAAFLLCDQAAPPATNLAGKRLINAELKTKKTQS